MKRSKKNIIGFSLFAMGIIMMLTGVMRGEHNDVFEKAIRICLECIGIG